MLHSCDYEKLMQDFVAVQSELMEKQYFRLMVTIFSTNVGLARTFVVRWSNNVGPRKTLLSIT